MNADVLKRLKYRLLSNLPGKRGARYLRKYSGLRQPEVTAAFDEALEAAAGKVCIDLGANLGEFTTRMAQVALHVYAFEPDPWTAGQLRARVAGLHNVTVIEAAAGVEDGRMPIFRSARFEADPHKGSLSTTLIPEKTNVGASSGETVEVKDFCAFLEALDCDVALLKIDIEGGEVSLLERLFDHPALARIDAIFVETHETKLPSLARRSRALRRRARGMTRPRVDMDWH